jgi:hypothetical protein
MIVARILEPGSKLAASRALDPATASSTLPEACGIDGEVDENDLHAAMDWLPGRQTRIEKSPAKRHLRDGSLVLYDLTSTWLEGACGPLAARGHSRDGKKGKLQIVFGLRRVGRVIDARKTAKHFKIEITDTGLQWHRDEEKIRREAATDGIHVVRTSLKTGGFSAGEIVEPKQPSRSARAKAARKRTPEGFPVHGFRTLLADLARSRATPFGPASPERRPGPGTPSRPNSNPKSSNFSPPSTPLASRG